MRTAQANRIDVAVQHAALLSRSRSRIVRRSVPARRTAPTLASMAQRDRRRWAGARGSSQPQERFRALACLGADRNDVDASRWELVETPVEFSQLDLANRTGTSTKEHDHLEPFRPRPAERRRRAAEEARANARAGEVVFLGAGRPMRLSSCQPRRRDDKQLVGCAVDAWWSWLAVKRLHHAECALALIGRASATRRRRRSRAGVHLLSGERRGRARRS